MLRSTRSRLNLVTCSINPLTNPAKGTGNIATVTLNHPASRNAMTVGMGEEFQEVIARLRKDDSIRATIITGSNGFFSAGGDATFLRQRLVSTKEENYVAMRAFYDRFLSLRTLNCPVIACLNGPAIGAGFCVALACDFRVVEHKAKLALNFTRIGIHPGMAATYTLPRLVGFGTASRLLIAGETILGSEAKELGIAMASCNGEKETMQKAIEVAENCVTASRIAVQETLQTLRGSAADLDKALDREARAQVNCYVEGRDLEEAMNALKEKRAAVFK